MPKRKVLSVKEKVEIIQEFEKGAKNVDICKRFGFSSSTVSTLMKNKDTILKAFSENQYGSKRLKGCEKKDLDKVLLTWFKAQRNANAPVSGPIVKLQAEKFAVELGYVNFVCSNGWLGRFKNRHGISFGKTCDRTDSVNAEGNSTWLPDSWTHYKRCYKTDSVNTEGNSTWLTDSWTHYKRCYKTDDIYNAVETGVFYNITPQEILKFKGEKCFGGKFSKNQLTILVCANMAGTDKRKLLVIGKTKNPRCFKHVKKLSVDYDYSSEAWMNSNIFVNYILKWERELKEQNRKILLLVDHCPAHPFIPGLTNIHIEFVPPNCTFITQPMDLGIIKSFKSHFRKQLIFVLHDKKESGRNTDADINVLEAIRLLTDAWESVSEKCIKSCFHKAGLQCFDVEQADDDEDNIDDSLLLLENLEMNVSEFEDFVSVDDYVITCELPTDSEHIVPEILTKTNAQSNDNNEEEGESHAEPPPTYKMASEYTEKLQSFFESRNSDDEVFHAMSIIRRHLIHHREKCKV